MKPGDHLPVARYRLRFRMEGELRLPEYAGSLLRGHFGAALRRAACMTGEKNCRTCPLWRTCPYPAIFEAPPPPEGHPLQRFSTLPNPYVIEAPGFHTERIVAGGVLEFTIVLVGHALNDLALIVHAWQGAFGQGIGHQRVRGHLQSVCWVPPQGEGVDVWDASTGRLLAHERTLQMPDLPATQTATLRFHTPLRLQHEGRVLRAAEVTPRRLIAQLIRRASLLLEMHAGLPLSGEEAALVRQSEALADRKALRWQRWVRYSSRQRQEMPFSGLCGDWELQGPALSALLPWLWLGQWLHAGKNATFGLGGYTLLQPPGADILAGEASCRETLLQVTEKSV